MTSIDKQNKWTQSHYTGLPHYDQIIISVFLYAVRFRGVGLKYSSGCDIRDADVKKQKVAG